MLVETGLDLAAPEAGSGAVLKIFVLDDAGEPHNGSMVAWARPVGGTFKDDVGADVVDHATAAACWSRSPKAIGTSACRDSSRGTLSIPQNWEEAGTGSRRSS